MSLVQRTRGASRWIGMGWLLLGLIAVLYCALRFAGPMPLQTNVLALVPPTEVDPVAEHAVDALAGAMGDRLVFLLESQDPALTKSAARQFGAQLAASGAVHNVLAQLPPFDPTQIGAFYQPFRYALLAPPDRAELTAGRADPAQWLARHLYSPISAAAIVPLADDPFGWLSHWLAALPFNTSRLNLEDGFLIAHRGGATDVMVSASVNGSAYDTSTQQAVSATVAAAEARLARDFPSVSLTRTGAVFYAQKARESAQHDVDVIGRTSLVGIALLMLLVFRSPKLLALGFVSTGLGVVTALAVTLAVFGRLHLLTLVFGASLIGEAVDYSIQYFVLYLAAGPDWDARRGMLQVRPALLVALSTSLLGYAMLLWVPFPVLKQVACFAMVGIAVAFGSVLSLLPLWLRRPSPRSKPALFAAMLRGLERWRWLLSGWRAACLCATVLLIAVPGWMRLTSNDDIHLLIQRDAGLSAQEQRVRTVIGVEDSSQFVLVKGENPEQVLQRSEALDARLAAQTEQHRLVAWQSVSQFVPSQQRQRSDHDLLATQIFSNPTALRAVLLQAGFRPAVADAYLRSYTQSHAYLDVPTWLGAPFSQPLRYLWLGRIDGVYATVVLPSGAAEGALADAVRNLPGVSVIDKAASVSNLFGQYRRNSDRWLVGALAMVLMLLIVRYGWRGGIAVLMPVLLAIPATLAFFGYAGLPLNLFNLLALMLVLGVGANYSVFLREGQRRGDEALGAVSTGVLLSAATTLLSFGLLGASAMPALRSFGITLSLGIGIAVLLAPLGMLGWGNSR